MLSLDIMTINQRTLFKKLTQFQQLLALELLRGKKPLAAYRIARPDSTCKDHVARITAAKTQTIPKVAEFVDSMKESAVNAAIMDRTEALARLTELGRASLSDMVDFGEAEVGVTEEGKTIKQTVWKIKDSALQDKGQLSAIAELTAGSQGLKIKLANQISAIQQLGAMQGWTKPLVIDNKSSDGSMTPAPTTVIALDVSKLSDSTLKEIAELNDTSDSNSG